MARGGARPGSGRKKGAANKATAEARKAALASGISPLDYMSRVMRDQTVDVRRRDAMAMAAAPYMHAKFAAVAHSGAESGIEGVGTRVIKVEFVAAHDGRPLINLPANVGDTVVPLRKSHP